MLLTVDHLNITTFCFYVSQIVIVVVVVVVVITFMGQRTPGKHLDESTPDKSLEEESLCTAHFRFPIYNF